MAKKQILIADDQPGIRRLLGEILDAAKYALFEAASGDEVIDILDHNQVNLIFLDVKMPNLDGIMTLKKIVERPGCPPVIIITAHAQPDLRKRAMNIGAKAYLEKPFDINIVLQLIEKLA